MKEKILFIAPHLSTGGLPQYLFKQMESLVDDFDVYCIEWENVTGGVLVIQRNRVVNLLGDRLITLPEDKHQLFTVIEQLQPDIIHIQEIPELFMSHDVAQKLYHIDRSYKLIETSHDSSFDTTQKIYLPDKFLMVSKYQENRYRVIFRWILPGYFRRIALLVSLCSIAYIRSVVIFRPICVIFRPFLEQSRFDF